LFAAIAGGLLTSSAFSARYASIVFLPFLVIVGLGAATLLNARGRVILLTVAVAAGLVIAVQSQHTQRTQAPEVAAVLSAQAKPGDIIAFCPDQLGPDTYRVISDQSQYKMVTFPRGIGPQFVDWVDYAAASRRGSPADFARNLERQAGSTHRVWLVWEAGYLTFGTKCEQLSVLLGQAPGVSDHGWVTARPAFYYEPMNLTEYAPSEK
jgi:mannosyltransferase